MISEGSFALPGARRHDGPSRTFDVLHIDLAVRPDLVLRTLSGICTLTVAAFDTPVQRLDLDAVDMCVESVRDADGPLRFTHRDATLCIELRAPLADGQTRWVAVAYRIERPTRGLFFVQTNDPANESVQCWTHGHAGGARYWFPCVDHLHQRQTSSMTIEVDAGLFALGNGELIARSNRADTTTTVFRYAQTQRHASYLMTMVVGRFTEYAPPQISVPVFAYVAPGREANAARTFGKTPAMIAALERFTASTYPFGRYSQIAVADFPFIGMENTTAPTFTDDWLLDEETLASPAVESLVVHELAHQWFGNLIASREWKDVWLNEGFASYCEAIWDEAHSGSDAYAYNIFRQVKAYLAEAARKYTRPIVCDVFREPIDLFDKHLYEKAGAVLHMLRGELGESRFQDAIARYVRDNAGKGIETIDLVRAIEASTGRNMRAFFEQWTQRSGHPIITVTVEWDADRRLLHVRLTQRQLVDQHHPAYRFTLDIGLLDERPDELQRCGATLLKAERRVRAEVDRCVSTCTIALDRAPALVRIDPGAWILGDFTLELGTELACAALAADPDPIARIRCARSLARDANAHARGALITALATDPFWGARVEYAAILGEARAPWAQAALARALTDRDAHVRHAVCQALGNYSGPEVAVALQSHINDEPSVEAIGAALHALGKMRAPDAVRILGRALTRQSWRDVIGAGALLGFAEIADAHAFGLVLTASISVHPNRRQSAIRALGALAMRRPCDRRAIRAKLIEALSDRAAMVRLQAIEAIESLGSAAEIADIAQLEALALREPIAWVGSHALRAAVRLRSAAPALPQLQTLNAELQTLRSDYERLRQRVDNARRCEPLFHL